MNKKDLIKAVADASALSNKDAEKAINAVTAAITDALKKGEKVQLVGFGTFEARKRAARNGRNPQTGATIKIAAKTVPAFSAGKKFKELVKK